MEDKNKVIAILTGIMIILLIFLTIIIINPKKKSQEKIKNNQTTTINNTSTTYEDKTTTNTTTSTTTTTKKEETTTTTKKQEQPRTEPVTEPIPQPTQPITQPPHTEPVTQPTQPQTQPTTEPVIQPTQPPQPTYSCLENYTLNDNKCTITIQANYVCPENTTDYSNIDIPSDTYCVNLSEGFETETESCPPNHGLIKMISLGGPDKYECLPLHNKIYTCDEGYTLINNQCTKTIDAIAN